MKRWLTVAALVVCAGCTSPTAPTTEYTCSTQPRVYFNPATGISATEIDRYTQSVPCPLIPIR